MGFDGIAVFIPPNLGLFNREYDYFLQNKEPMLHTNHIEIYGYDWRQMPSLHYGDIKDKVYESLNFLMKRECHKIGFHGIRTYDNSEYQCEESTIFSTLDWLFTYGDNFQSLTMVDYKGGFNRHSNMK